MDAAKKYEYIKTLGEGSYGHVWLCRDRERDCLVAIKKFKDANKDSQAYHLAMREIKLLRATTHEHVVSVIEAFRSQSSGNVYLVMEYADSCLNLELKKHRTGLPSADVVRVTWQLASALQYLHSKKIIHRDLKPANILLTAVCDLKLCDFGFARDLPPAGQQADMSSYVTTRWYRAPEVVVGADYGAAVDIWALGCLFAELLNGQPLFPGASNMDQLALIVACFGHLPNRLLAKALTNPHLAGVQLRTGNPRNWAVALQQRFSPFGEHAVDLLLSCLNPDPLKRATADEVMRSPYFEPIRLKKIPALNGPPSVSVTAVASASALPPSGTATTAAALIQSATVPVTAASAAALVHSATAPQAAALAADASTAAAAATSTKVAKEAPPTVAQEHKQQQPEVVATPPSEAFRRLAQEPELQPERPALVSFARTAQAGTAEQPGARPAPLHPAISTFSKVAAAAAATPQAVAMELDTPPAAPAPPVATQPQRSQAAEQPPSARDAAEQRQYLQSCSRVVDATTEAEVTADRHAAPSIAASSSVAAVLHDALGSEAGLPQPYREARLAANGMAHMRASVAAIPMIASSASAVRAITDTGIGGCGAGQAPALPPPGKAGATLVNHNKRASEQNFGVYGNPRGGAANDTHMRIARISVINPNMDTGNPQPENTSASTSPVTTPTGAAAAGAAGSNVLISPAGSFTGGAAAGPHPHGRRRSTATGSRLTRVSHTCEGPDQLNREEDSEDERSGEQVSLHATVAGAPAQPMPCSGAAPMHPSPLRRPTRLSAVTEPGGQYPPGSIAAAGAAAFAAATESGVEHQVGGVGRGVGTQMLSPLGRAHQRNLLASTVSVGAMAAAAAGSGSTAAADSGHYVAAPPVPSAAAAHGHLHTTMSSMSLNTSGREKDISGEVSALGGMLRGNANHNVPTPAAPTQGQMRSFTTQGAGTSAAAAAAAGLMSRPVSNLYMCVENGKAAEGSSADSSAAVSPCTPNGSASGGPAPPPGRRHTLVDGPGSILRSMLRSLSTRRATTTSLSGLPVDQQPAPTAPIPVIQQQAVSIGGASGGQGSSGSHSQASLGSSPFCTSRASSNNFIMGGPVNSDGSLSGPVAIHGDDHGTGASTLGPQRRSTTTALSAAPAAAVGHARIGLPQLSVRANDLAAGPAGAAPVNGYGHGPAVVSPAARRRTSALAPGQALRMPDAGTVVGQKQVPGVGANGPVIHQAGPPTAGIAALHGIRPAPPADVAHARLQSKQSKDAS